MILRRFLKYIRKYWKLQAVAIGVGLIVVPLTLVNPYLTKLVIDKAYGNRDLKLFFILAVIGGLVFMVNGIIGSFGRYLSRRICFRLNADITRDVFAHLQRLPFSFFAERSSGEHVYKINRDVSSVSNFLSQNIPHAARLLPRLIFTLIVVFYLNWRLALLAALMVPVGLIHPYFFGRLFREMTVKVLRRSQDVFKRLCDVLRHIYLVKALGREDFEIKKFNEGLSRKIDFEIQNAKLKTLNNFSGTVMNRVISGAVALYGGYQVIKGTITLGSLTAVMIYLNQLINMVRSIGRLYQEVIVSSVSAQRLGEILETKPEAEGGGKVIDRHTLKGSIEFKNLYFGYKKGEFILKGVNFSIEPGAKIALIGPSGCGKTTLLNLVLGLYRIERGSILIDGLDIKDIHLRSLRKEIGIVFQRPFLWNDTVANNIAYGVDDAGQNEIIRSAELATADEFIRQFPQGYNSVIGEEGCNISAGQKQRLSLARAFIKKPKILIMDEAMSFLNPMDENRIVDNVLREFADSTVLIVSHRVPTLEKMDEIYTFRNHSFVKKSRYQEILIKDAKSLTLNKDRLI